MAQVSAVNRFRSRWVGRGAAGTTSRTLRPASPTEPTGTRRGAGARARALLFVATVVTTLTVPFTTASASAAEPVIRSWTLSGVTFEDGGTASGTFDLSSEGQMTNVDISTAGGTVLPPFRYGPGFTGLPSDSGDLYIIGASNDGGVFRFLALTSRGLNTADTGDVVLLDSRSFECNNCLAFRRVTGGALVAGDVVTPPPVENTAPVAVPDSYSTVQNTPLAVAAPGVLGNDTDGDQDPLTATPGTDPANGTLTLAADGSFSYTPQRGFVGTDTFTYTAADPTGTSEPATVTITVTAATCDTTPPPGSIVGSAGNNILNGTAGADFLYGLGGNDVILGRGGDDLICGGTGNDALFGGDGDDRISGQAGNDAIDGGPGTNTIDGGPGTDACRNPRTGPGCP